jgi:YHS domain-containing protein
VIRRLLLLAAIVLIVWGFRRLFASRRPSTPGASARLRVPRSGSEMVRDRVCNTFLPRDRALSVQHHGVTHYFCSEACRSRYLEGSRAVS